MPVYLFGYSKCMLCSEHLNRMLMTKFENLNSISNISQELHDFLVLTDPLIICINLRRSDRHFCDQVNVRHPTSKLPKCDLVQILNTFQNSSLLVFATGKASVSYKRFFLRPISITPARAKRKRTYARRQKY